MAKITCISKNLLTLVLFLTTALGISQTSPTTYNSGTNTFTVPAGVTTITVEAWGGGGRGGTMSDLGFGGGGGAGAYAKRTINVTPGQQYTVVVGAGSNSTSPGGDSTFGGTLVRAKGGQSAGNNDGDGAAGGNSNQCIGDQVISGNNGASATLFGGSGAGGSSPNGGNGGNGRGALSQGNGNNGAAPGGGGGGAVRLSGGTRNGGNGGAGRVRISWSPVEINVTGNGVNIADGDTSPTTTDGTNFGNVSLSQSLTRTFVIQNTGGSVLSIGAITFSGTAAGDYSIVTPPASTVNGGSSTSFTVQFTPSVSGDRAATISIVNNDANENPYDFRLTGKGVTPEINVKGNGVNIAHNSMTPTSGNWTIFSGANVTNDTSTRTFVIENVGGSTGQLNIGTISITGPHASDFSVTTSPSSTVNAGQSTSFVITFNPSATGTRSAIISIANNDLDENPYVFAIQGDGYTNEINVTGNGITIPDGTTTTSATNNTDFGSVSVVTGTATRTFQIWNDASASGPVIVTGATFSGTGSGDFSVTTPMPMTVNPGTSANLTVVFDPSAAATRTVTMNIANNDADENPYNFNLKGIGGSPEIEVRGNNAVINDGDTSPANNDHTIFPNTEITSATSTRTYTIYNTSAATMPLTISGITITGTNAGDFYVSSMPDPVVPIDGSTTFTITFDPSATGTRNAVVNISNDDANENPYNFNIQGVGTSPEISVVSNNVTIAHGDTTPSVADNTDFGTVAIEAGSTVNTYTIRNTGVGNLWVGQVTISGPGASSFALMTNPAATVAAGSSTSFTIAFNPNTLGVKNATVFIANDDADENPYSFAITGLGVRTFLDTDGDGIGDNIDIDDDNDGILDIYEQADCASNPLAGSVEHVFLNETFGAGTTRAYINVNVPGATCNYCFEDGIVQPNTTACPSQSSWILDDGEYTVVHKIAGTVASDPENIHGDLAWNGPEDHTPGDVNGRMAVFNASYTPGTFYETTISGILPNVPITYGFWVLNIMSKHNYNGSILPNITVEFLDMSNNVLSTFNTGNIGRCNGGTGVNTCDLSQWQQYSTTVNLGNITEFIIRFKNNAPGGGGNDLAIDDITIKQVYCDSDGDGVANIFDLDSDNDGIPDIEEAGFKQYSNKRAVFDMITASAWVDENGNGLHDAIDAMIAAGTYNLPDTDSDNVPDFLDLDSDNDGLFDIDEAGLLNGDGDIDGDGVGDGTDSDNDGILDIFDIGAGNGIWGTIARDYAQDTDGDSKPDYLDTDSNNDGVYDIAESLYASLDANNDGVIDGTADVDKDGIRDAFDTDTTALGSPRDLDRKLFLEFDGRNDYAEATQMLSGLPKATIMGWIKVNSSFNANAFVMGQDNFNLKISPSGGRRLVATANGVSITYTTSLAVDRWYHIAAVYDGTASTDKLKLFVNGAQVLASNNGSLAGQLNNSTAPFTMGKNATNSTLFYKGSLDEVRVFNTALTTDQLQKMVYQEIKQNGSAIRGEVIPKDIEDSSWSSLLAYYRMDAYKHDVIDNYVTGTIDEGSSTSFARIYNVKTIKPQLAPMPFETTISGQLDSAVSQNNFVNGMDVFQYEWSIVRINHNIKMPYNQTSLGLFIDENAEVTLTNDNAVRNTWYMKLDGVLDLEGRSQLVQTLHSDLDPTSKGYIERDQQGQTNKFNYNYWSSPVGAINPTSNNNAYTVAGVMKDGTNPLNWQNIQWTSGLNGSPTSPITLSSYWVFKFQNVDPSYANWITLGPNGSLLPGEGYTLKGSGAATPTQNYVFVGKPNNGEITSTIAPGNMNLSGNPYASALDADQFLLDNLTSTTGAIYFWEHFSTNNSHVLQNYQGGYSVRTLVGGTPPVAPEEISGNGSSTRIPGRFIPVGQGFFLTGSATGGPIKFNNGQRAFIREDNADSNIMFRTANMLQTNSTEDFLNNNEDVYEEVAYKKIRLGYKSPDNYHRQILLGFMEDRANAALNPGYDALHIDGQPSDMYFMLGSAKLNIQGVGYFNENDIFPVGVKAITQGNIEFMIDGMENFDEGQEVYIYDSETDIYHDITSGPVTLQVPAGATDNRFSLRFKSDTSLGVNDSTLDNGIHVAYATNDNLLNIKNTIMDVTVKDVLLYNMLGQSVFKANVGNQDQQNIMVPVKNLASGTYIVKIMTSKGETSRKIVIK